MPGGHPQHSTEFEAFRWGGREPPIVRATFTMRIFSWRDAMNPTSDLPDRFPVGTRYVIEGRAGRIVARFVELPDGRRLNLTAAGSSRKQGRRVAGARRARSRA